MKDRLDHVWREAVRIRDELQAMVPHLNERHDYAAADTLQVMICQLQDCVIDNLDAIDEDRKRSTLRHRLTHGRGMHTTRWHRVKCKVRFTWHMVIKSRIKDWWKGETYVPLWWDKKAEIRAMRWSIINQHSHGNEVFVLPPGIESYSDLPHFKTSDACYAYIHETWPQWAP